MRPVTVTSPKQVVELPAGSTYVVSLPGFDVPDHDPLELSAALIEFRAEVAKLSAAEPVGDVKGNNGNGKGREKKMVQG